MFISFEGVDGCGKTTQLELLRAHLESAGHAVLATREPGGTGLAEAIRAYLLHSEQPLAANTELLLFGAARAQHVAEVIRPALERDTLVLCDRYTDSTVAYQGSGLGLDADFIARLNTFATGGLMPDLTFVVNVPLAIGLERRANQGKHDRIEGRGPGFQERVRAAFLALAEAAPERVIIIDGSPPAKVVHGRIWKEVQRMLEQAGAK